MSMRTFCARDNGPLCPWRIFAPGTMVPYVPGIYLHQGQWDPMFTDPSVRMLDHWHVQQSIKACAPAFCACATPCHVQRCVTA